MDDESINEDLTIMDERMIPSNVLDSRTFLKPVKSLELPVPVVLDIDDDLQDAIALMRVKQIGCLLVTKGDQLSGILTERDIIAKAIGNESMNTMKVRDIMTPHPESFQETDELAYVVKAMWAGGYRHVPIVNDRNEPVGLVSVKDIIRFIVEHFPEEIMNLPPAPLRKASERDGG